LDVVSDQKEAAEWLASLRRGASWLGLFLIWSCADFHRSYVLYCKHQSGLAAEQKAGLNEVAAWSSRGSELETDSKELAIRARDEASRLSRELSAAETSRQEGLRSMMEQDQRSGKRLSVAVTGSASLSVALSEARAQVEVLEARIQGFNNEQQRLEDEYRTVSSQLREADEVLERATVGNEGLRKQMEAQQADAHRACEAALRSCQESFKQELADLQRSQRLESEVLEAKLQSLEKELAEKAAEAVSLELKENSQSLERVRLERERALWKAQQDLATKLQAEIEAELQQARSTWEKELQDLKAQEAESLQKKHSLQDELQSTNARAGICQQEAEHGFLEARRKAASLESQVREVDLMLVPVREAFKRKVAALSSARGEAGEKRALTLESQDKMQHQLAQLAQEAVEARSRLEAELMVERERLQRAQAQCEEYRKRGRPWVESTHEERLEASVRQAKQEAEAERQAADITEAEAKEAQKLLADQELRLQEETVKLRALRSEAASTRRRLDVDAAAEALADSAYRQQAQIAESRLQSVYRQHEHILAASRERMRMELDHQRHAMDVAEDENRRLKRAGTAARMGVEDSLSRMRSRTDQLRKDLQLRQSGNLEHTAPSESKR